MAPAYQHEEIAPVPRGYKVRTVRRGQHEIRLAFPPGRRQKGSGVLVEILHPTGENPQCRIANFLNPTKLELQRATRERAKRIRAARKNPEDPKPGDLVKVVFTRFGQGERLWVRVTGKRGSKFTGVLDNEPVVIHKELGDKVRFSASQIVRDNPDLFDAIRPGSRVTFVDKQAALRGEHKLRTGRATMPSGSDGWVLNMGGAHGTPQVVHRDMVVKVSGRRNPDDGQLAEAESLYEEFHGREPREILAMQESSETRGEYTALGELVELTMIAPTGDHVLIKFKNDGVRVASSPEGEQLYLLGGNQDISGHLAMFGADDAKDLIDLGEAKQIVYEAAKWQTDFTPQEWKHNFGEESKVRPRGFYDQLKKRIFFAGGTYQVKRPGIID